MSPLDGSGNYRHNDQVAKLHGGMKEPKLAEPKEKEPSAVSEHTEVHDHGDGSFHTVHPEHGEVQHANIGEMHAHLSAIHGQPGAKHFHAHHDGMEAHSHAVESGGEADHQEHDPENIEAIKDHLGKFFNEEEQEGTDGGYEQPQEAGSALGM
jgi:hypothetical protein